MCEEVERALDLQCNAEVLHARSLQELAWASHSANVEILQLRVTRDAEE